MKYEKGCGKREIVETINRYVRDRTYSRLRMCSPHHLIFLLPLSTKLNLAAQKPGALPGGLHNEGNTCFLNAAIQALCSSRVFLRFVRDNANKSPLCAALWKLSRFVNQRTKGSHAHSAAGVCLIVRKR